MQILVEPRFIPVSDQAVLVEFGTTISDPITQAVQSLDRAIAKNKPAGVIEVTPAFVNLLVVFDPLQTRHELVVEALLPMLEYTENSKQTPTVHSVAVCYDPPFSPDLEAVARQSQLEARQVIEAHLSARYKVGMYGFAPGYAYLSGTPTNIQVPRKAKPIRDIPAGSVMIAGPQCLVTTLTMPTGWSVIGRSPTIILTDDPDKPFLFEVGDEVEFRCIDQQQFHEQEGRKSHG